MKVHILATCRRPELLDAALLVFRTLRTGFPSAEVHVWGNGLSAEAAHVVESNCNLRGCYFFNVPRVSHDAWIEHIIFNEPPCWILDTDVVFWENIERWDLGSAVFAGRYEPEFHEEYYYAIRVPRLHTAVMWLNCPALRVAIRAFLGKFPPPFGATLQVPIIRQTIIPRLNQIPLFYDSMAGLWQAGMGTAFTPKQDAAFDHLHAATYIDLLAPNITGADGLVAAQRAIYQDHRLAKGIKVAQDRYFKERTAERKGGFLSEPASHT